MENAAGTTGRAKSQESVGRDPKRLEGEDQRHTAGRRDRKRKGRKKN
jgi:hypothetical protein